MLIQERGGRNLLISHIADSDGIGSLVLCRLNPFECNNDVLLVKTHNLHNVIVDLKNKNFYRDFRGYSKIYISDLSIQENIARLIDSSPELRKRILNFDHHCINYDTKKFEFVHSVCEKNGIKNSGTSLFYEYLLRKYPYDAIINSKKIRGFVEAIRSYDNFEHVISGDFTGKYLGYLLCCMGISKYVSRFEKVLSEETDKDLSFSKTENEIILNFERREERYINECDKNLIRIRIRRHMVGVSLSNKFKSSVGYELSRRHKSELDYIMIFDPNIRSFSLRTANELDLSKIVREISGAGGGLKQAAGGPFNEQSYWIYNEVMKKAAFEGKSGLVKIK